MLVSASTLLLLATAVTAQPRYLTPKTESFVVNGSALPEVDFDIGESYAGYLDKSSGDSSLYFWFFPTENPAADDEITIWLSGGPGCSSLLSLFQETGPVLWRPGTNKPVRNPYSWSKLTNVVFVDQPSGTGFSLGPSTVNNEEDVAREFKGFWKNFMETFDLKNRKVYITGESYAGYYAPYIASGMLDEEDKDYFNVAGLHIIDPVINDNVMQQDVPAASFLNHYRDFFALNNTFVEEINQRANDCGYTVLQETALRFPPLGKLPPPPTNENPGCDIWNAIYEAARLVNPCFNQYHIREYCPYLWNVMAFPSSSDLSNAYFNRSDVQQAINAYPTDYYACVPDDASRQIFPKGDPSQPSSYEIIPGVIERTNNTVISQAMLDYILIANGTLASIQNMTWNGVQGFHSAPSKPLFVPYLPHYPVAKDEYSTPFPPMNRISGAGYMGTVHTERGLTYTTVDLSGHQLPQYTPGVAYRQLELLLGRVSDLSEEVESFTTEIGW